MRATGLVVASVAACLVAGCGQGGPTPAPDGSQARPQRAERPTGAGVVEAHGAGGPPAAPATAPAQAALPGHEDEKTTPSAPPTPDPCRLVSRARAERIVGTRLRASFLAPQGPTCIYRAARGARVITLAVQESSLRAMAGGVSERRSVAVGGRRALCIGRDSATLLVRLSQRRTLVVGAPCAVGRRLAAHAVDRLDATS
jgi:hypothetical protein